MSNVHIFMLHLQNRSVRISHQVEWYNLFSRISFVFRDVDWFTPKQSHLMFSPSETA